jgi:hypothetical protein
MVQNFKKIAAAQTLRTSAIKRKVRQATSVGRQFIVNGAFQEVCGSDDV